MPAKKIEDVLKEHTDNLMGLPSVVGTGQGLCDDKPGGEKLLGLVDGVLGDLQHSA